MGKIGIIIQREFNERVRKKSFLITTILTPLLFVGIMLASIYLSTNSFKQAEKRTILVYDESGQVSHDLESDDRLEFIPTEIPPSDYISGAREPGDKAYGILSIGSDIGSKNLNVQLYTFSGSTIDVELAVARAVGNVVEAGKLSRYDIDGLPQILEDVKTNVSVRSYKINDSGEQKESSAGMSMTLAFVLGFLVYMFVFMYGVMVMQGVIEEKSSKVLEIIVSSVKPFQLMMGKILGIAAVAFTQFMIWVVLIIVIGTAAMYFIGPEAAASAAGDMPAGMMGGIDQNALSAIGYNLDVSMLIRVLAGFLVYFIGGYLLYAAFFAAIGSAVDNATDTQQLQLPVTIPLILAIVVLMGVMREPDSAVAVWFSLIPFTSPIIMVARLPYGVPMWELVLSVVLLYATFIFMVWLAGKVYRVGIFMYGKKPTFKELIKWARYKY